MMEYTVCVQCVRHGLNKGGNTWYLMCCARRTRLYLCHKKELCEVVSTLLAMYKCDCIKTCPRRSALDFGAGITRFLSENGKNKPLKFCVEWTFLALCVKLHAKISPRLTGRIWGVVTCLLPKGEFLRLKNRGCKAADKLRRPRQSKSTFLKMLF